jgi:hypothetical protein
MSAGTIEIRTGAYERCHILQHVVDGDIANLRWKHLLRGTAIRVAYLCSVESVRSSIESATRHLNDLAPFDAELKKIPVLQRKTDLLAVCEYLVRLREFGINFDRDPISGGLMDVDPEYWVLPPAANFSQLVVFIDDLTAMNMRRAGGLPVRLVRNPDAVVEKRRHFSNRNMDSANDLFLSVADVRWHVNHYLIGFLLGVAHLELIEVADYKQLLRTPPAKATVAPDLAQSLWNVARETAIKYAHFCAEFATTILGMVAIGPRHPDFLFFEKLRFCPWPSGLLRELENLPARIDDAREGLAKSLRTLVHDSVVYATDMRRFWKQFTRFAREDDLNYRLRVRGTAGN